MRSIIHQTVLLPAQAENLFNMYLNPSIHEAITGAKVTISGQPGSEFNAFNGMLTGTMLTVIEPKLIIQSWRSGHFKDSDPDSTLILSFSPESNNGRIDLIHLDVPEHDYQQVVEGWKKFYWETWRKYLES
ncbi:MAG: SRPBCC domain-containing protein [Thermodesulfobacteriota bacterium]